MSALEILSLGQLVAQQPGRLDVFRQFRIDCWCDGRKTLRRACADAGVDHHPLVRALDSPGEQPPSKLGASRAITALIDHIEEVHHVYLRRELPSLVVALGELKARYASEHPRLAQLHTLFAQYDRAMQAHLDEEEREVFPVCRSFCAGTEPTSALRQTLQRAFSSMVDEHDATSLDLERVLALSDNLTPPHEACREVYARLRLLEQDMHKHIFEENSILFPMVCFALTC